MSPAKDLGTKYSCWKCETKFYDLHKAVPLCPKCGADQRESPALKAPVKESRKRPVAKVKEPVPEVEAAPAETDEEAPEADEEADEAAPDEDDDD